MSTSKKRKRPVEVIPAPTTLVKMTIEYVVPLKEWDGVYHELEDWLCPCTGEARVTSFVIEKDIEKDVVEDMTIRSEEAGWNYGSLL